MKTALITTTINVPHFLKGFVGQYYDRIYVAADHKTPREAYEFCAEIPNCEIYSPERQKELGYSCSELIGWNCIQRKNIALLEAVKHGADLIVTTDDDNLAMTPNHVHQFGRLFWNKWSGIEVGSANGWFDLGQLLTPSVRHRGLPIDVPTVAPQLQPVSDVKIGVAAGLWIGDGDVDACNRIAVPPVIHSATELAHTGVVVSPYTRTVFNAQNVAFLRELAPAAFLASGLGRHDDIFASLIMQRVMRESDLQVHIGQPFTACWQNRSTESLLNDLGDEIWGMRHVAAFVRVLDAIILPGYSVIDDCRTIYESAQVLEAWPKRASETAAAFFDDLEKVL